MKTSLRIASLALLGAALCSGRATADIAQYNPATGHTNVTPSRPVDGSLLESAVPPSDHVGTPYKPGNGVVELLSDPIVADQTPSDLTLGGFYSDAVPGQFYSQRIADNFTVAGPSGVIGISTIEWWGGSEFFSNPDLTNMASFTVELYADAGGVPGALLHSETVPTAATNPTFVASSFNGSDVYHQYLDLSRCVPASNGDDLWVSIGATLFNGFDDAWVWNISDTGDNYIAADFFDGNGYQTFSGFGDVAFVAHACVPEPSTIALGSFGLMALAYAALRRKA